MKAKTRYCLTDTRVFARLSSHHAEICLAHRRPGKQPVVFACIGTSGATLEGE